MSDFIPLAHKVDRMRFVLHTERGKAGALQQCCSRLIHAHLKQDLDALMQALSEPLNKTLRIDKLTLNLGDIPWQDFDSQLPQRLLKQLGQRLQEVVARALAEPPDTAKREAAQQQMPPNPRPVSLALSEARELWFRYLERGYYPHPALWQAPGGADQWLLEQLKLDAPNADGPPDAARWQAELARCCWQAAPLRRLVQSLGRATLRRLGQWLVATASPRGLPQLMAEHPEAADIWLPLCALQYFEQYPEAHAHAPTPDLLWPSSKPAAAQAMAWLERWQATQAAGAVPLAAQLLSNHQTKHRHAVGKTPAGARAESLQAALPLPLPVSNAGLALLWLMLPRWLSQVGLVAEQRFVDTDAQNKAVLWLDALAWGGMPGEAIHEWRTPLSKHLCGLPLDTLLEPWELTPAERAAQSEQQEQWLATLPNQLPQLQRCSVQDLRSMFLQRPGQLRWQDERWLLEVEPEASDVLLREVPWPMTQVLLPWLDNPLPVAWLAGEGRRHG